MWSQNSNMFIVTGTSLILNSKEGLSSLLDDDFFFFKLSQNHQSFVIKSISDQPMIDV